MGRWMLLAIACWVCCSFVSAIVKVGYHHSGNFYLSSRVQVWTFLFSFLPSLNYQGINIWGSMCFKWDSRTKSGHPSKSIIEAILSVSETENKLDRLMCSASLICTCSQKLRISRGYMHWVSTGTRGYSSYGHTTQIHTLK